ncbi:hypothetical protein [uncultured Paludibaculum sp.]|uniref:hypothetical protein n=1 Tax=uncultured Paludibaculum sp. TaxID=1765020 RepID=UPI002AAB10B2|nr:hypothetical protein [uncultured Paludibaculum sp.]
MNTRAILDRIPHLHLLVAGDLWLDRWARYDPFLSEPSPETGLASTAIVATESAPGGSALSASILAALGARVSLLGVTGDDGSDLDLRRALERACVPSDHLIGRPGPTAVSTRLINTRTDAEDAPRLEVVQFQQPAAILAEFYRRLEHLAVGVDAVIMAFHRAAAAGGLNGVETRAVLNGIAERGPVVWLETPRGLEQIRGASRTPLTVEPDGVGGLRIMDGDTMQTVPERTPTHPLDLHGARESFSAVFAAALAAGAPASGAARFALLAAAVCMMKPGAGCASPGEIARAELEWSE